MLLEYYLDNLSCAEKRVLLKALVKLFRLIERRLERE